MLEMDGFMLLEKIKIKPVSRQELHRLILRALGKRTATASCVASPDSVPEPAISRVLRILLAEDSIFNQRVSVGLLSRMGHTVVVANNGREAVEIYAREKFDAVFMDIQMPEMDGFRATQMIRDHEKKSGTRVPIVALTAHAMSGDREKCLAADMDEYMAKPIRREELLRVIDLLASSADTVKASASSEKLTEHLNPAPPAAGSGSVLRIDTVALLHRCGGDQELMQTVMEMFPEESRRLIHLIEQAQSAKDAKNLQLHAHTLKGMCKMFGAMEAAEAAYALEKEGSEGRVGADQQIASLIKEMTRALAAVAEKSSSPVPGMPLPAHETGSPMSSGI